MQIGGRLIPLLQGTRWQESRISLRYHCLLNLRVHLEKDRKMGYKKTNALHCTCTHTCTNGKETLIFNVRLTESL